MIAFLFLGKSGMSELEAGTIFKWNFPFRTLKVNSGLSTLLNSFTLNTKIQITELKCRLAILVQSYLHLWKT